MPLYNGSLRKTSIEMTYRHLEISHFYQLYIYKVFSRCLCKRLVEFISNKIFFWQRAYLEKRDRRELIFYLITEIDDLKHLSTKIYVTLIDFANAFGNVSHEFIFDSLERFNKLKRIAL